MSDSKAMNEISMEMMGIMAFNARATKISGSRAVMFGTQFSQSIVLKNSEPHRNPSGIEQEFGKYTFEVKMPADGKILHTIQRYPRSAAEGAISRNPETIVIYENEETKVIDYFVVTDFQSYHQTFGFANVFTDKMDQLRPNNHVKGGTVFAHSPRLGFNKIYMPGLNLNTAFMSLPATAEDGFILSESAARKMEFNFYESRRAGCGANTYPLNIFGTKDRYQCMPEIGDKLREDGLLMVFRTYDDDLSPVEMSVMDTMEPNMYFDTPLYAKAGNGVIKDIKVTKNNSQVRNLPELMSEQFQKYERAQYNFHKEIIDVERKLRYDYKRKFGVDGLKISPKLHRLVVKSMAIVGHNPYPDRLTQSINLLHRKEPLDEYTIEFVIEYTDYPRKGNKMTDMAGGKGIIVLVLPDEYMPVDAAGNRAEIVTAPEATPNRMNIGRTDLQFHAGAARDITVMIRNIIGLDNKATLEQVEFVDERRFNTAYEMLLKYYKIISKEQFEFFSACDNADRREHIYDIVKDGIYPFIPVDTQLDTTQMIFDIEDNFSLTYGPVTYKHHETEEMITTVDWVEISPMYYMLLDKFGTEWSSTSSSKVHIHGILSQLTKSEKYSRPYRDKSTRTIDETGGRIKVSYAGPRLIAELMDRSNNPNVTKHIYYKLLTHDNPSNIDVIVDRDLHPYGYSRTIQHMNHVFNIAGFKISFKPEALYG